MVTPEQIAVDQTNLGIFHGPMVRRQRAVACCYTAKLAGKRPATTDWDHAVLYNHLDHWNYTLHPFHHSEQE
jgi:hypothetical protein